MGFNSRTPGGVRLTLRAKVYTFQLFQFTHPGRGATVFFFSLVWAKKSFNSRTPGGVRRRSIIVQMGDGAFQFTHPGRGATHPHPRPAGGNEVSIHAPREGCDR